MPTFTLSLSTSQAGSKTSCPTLVMIQCKHSGVPVWRVFYFPFTDSSFSDLASENCLSGECGEKLIHTPETWSQIPCVFFDYHFIWWIKFDLIWVKWELPCGKKVEDPIEGVQVVKCKFSLYKLLRAVMVKQDRVDLIWFFKGVGIGEWVWWLENVFCLC
jgi:hypothetical protein